MRNILIGTGNPFKRAKLMAMVAPFLRPVISPSLPDVEEPEAGTFADVARAKAEAYSLLHGGLAIASDGGAVFPGLPKWNPLTTRRFLKGDDHARIAALLGMLDGVEDRTVRWQEAIAVAENGKTIFSAEAEAMPGTIDVVFDENRYKEGIWLCSITSFPQFGGRNYFELAESERAMTEDSWSSLAESLAKWCCEK